MINFIIFFILSLVFTLADFLFDISYYYEQISIFLLIIYMIFLLVFFSKNTSLFLFISWVILYLSSTQLAAFFIDVNSGFLLYEVNEITHPSSTSIFMFSFNILSISGALFGCFFVKQKIIFLDKKIDKDNFFSVGKGNLELFFIVSFILFLSIFTILMYIDKPAFLVGMSKVVYSKEVLNPTIDKVLRNAVVFIPAVACLLVSKKSLLKKIGTFCLVIYMVSLLWIGHKFGLLMYVVYFSSLCFISFQTNFNVKKIIIIISVIIIGLLLIVLISASISFDLSVSKSIEYLVNRVAQQSQIWYTIQLSEEFNNWHVREFLNEVKTFGLVSVPDNIRMDIGIYKVMKLSMPYQDYLLRFSNGQNLAFGFYALLTYYFDFSIALIFSFFIFVFYGAHVGILIKLLNQKEFFASLIIARLIMMLHAVIIQGDLFRIISADSMILYFLFVVFLLFKRKLLTRNNRSRA